MRPLRAREYCAAKAALSIAAALILSLGVAAGNVFGATAKQFQVFNAINYIGTPNLSEYGIVPIKIIYESDLDDPPLPFSKVRRYSAKKIALAAQEAAREEDKLVILDMETWGWNQNAMRKYAEAVKSFKRAYPVAKVGMFGVTPNNIALPYAAYSKNRLDLITKWEALQPIAAPVVSEVDVLAPEVYTIGDNMHAWDEEAKLIVRYARQAAPGKPVYVFVWPQYLAPHAGCERGSIGATFIPAAAWRNEMETLYTVADGVILWSPRWACAANSDKVEYPRFSTQMPWFQETLDFMKAHNIR